MWPALMVVELCKTLPERYTAEPRVHLGKNFEVDICTFEVQGESGFDLNEDFHLTTEPFAARLQFPDCGFAGIFLLSVCLTEFTLVSGSPKRVC